MYLSHFGLNEQPFTLTPNTQFYFGLPSHNEAMEVLRTALDAGEGFIKVTGEVGSGKTLLCRKLLNELPDNFPSAYIPNPMLSPQEFRRAVAAEIGVVLQEGSDQQQFTRQIEDKLIEKAADGLSVVLIVDEAQAMPDETIEALRLMTNLETESKKLLQVVLFGQPELDQKLASPRLRQLRQRITFSYQLKQMDADQVEQYVQHRLQVAGYKGAPVFGRAQCRAMVSACHGTARLINVVSHKALMLAYGEGKREVSVEHVNYAVKDTEATRSALMNRYIGWIVGSLAIVFLVITLIVMWQSGGVS